MGRTGGAGGAISKIQGEMGRNAPLGAPSGIYALTILPRASDTEMYP